MLIRVPSIRQTLDLLRTEDPERDALKRAIRAAIMVPLTAGLAFALVGGRVTPLYALLGAFWLLVVTEFPGNRQQRAVAYLGLTVNGIVLIAVGTLVAPIAWLAVTLMFFLAVAVTLASMLSSTMSAGQRATLLFYVWPVCTPVGPVGGRLLGWLIAVLVADNTGATLGTVRPAALDILRCCARLLDKTQLAHRAENRAALDQALSRLRSLARAGYREDVELILSATDDASASATGRQLLGCRVITTTIGLTGRVVAAAAAADARPVWARALGLQLPPTGFADRLSSETAAGTAIVTGFLNSRSVAAHNGLRMGVGLALAVAVTHLHLVEHGFWVVVGTMLVLSSSALSTRTKVVQAVTGTAVGIVLGALLVAAVGVQPVVLWLLVPITLFASTYLPRFVSFTAAQAMAALSLLVILNLLAPAGWRVGLLRIQDIAMGAAVGLTVSLLLWPRGATAAVSALIEAAVDVNLRYLQAAVLRVTRDRSEEGRDEIDANLATLSYDAVVASRRVDDAVRHYLSETGSGADLRTPVVRAANRATWLRLAADMIADIRTLPPSGAYPSARAVLEARLEFVTEQVSGHGDTASRPMVGDVALALRAEPPDQYDAVEAAQPMVTVAANLAELELISIKESETNSAATGSVTE